MSTIGVDTDVLVNWAVVQARHHRAVRQWVDGVLSADNRLGLTHQVIYEFTHVVTDGRRFEQPLAIDEAVGFVRSLWSSREVVRVVPRVSVVTRMSELIERFKLGRKRILDTALAATLEAAGIGTLATLNPRDYEVLPFLEVVDPSRSS